MKKYTKPLWLPLTSLSILALLSLGMVGCDSDAENALEDAGDETVEAVEDAGEAVEDTAEDIAN